MQENKVYLESLGEDYLNHKLGNGSCADCYLLNEKEVLKVIREFFRDYDKILKNSKYISDVFVFPKRLVFSDL